MSKLLEISNKHELLTLHRALFEAKFHPDPYDQDILASPYLAATSFRIIDALVDMGDSNDGGSSWREWQKVERHERPLLIVSQRIADCKSWYEWNQEQKQEYVKLLLAPLIADQSTLEELVETGDKCHREV